MLYSKPTLNQSPRRQSPIETAIRMQRRMNGQRQSPHPSPTMEIAICITPRRSTARLRTAQRTHGNRTQVNTFQLESKPHDHHHKNPSAARQGNRKPGIKAVLRCNHRPKKSRNRIPRTHPEFGIRRTSAVDASRSRTTKNAKHRCSSNWSSRTTRNASLKAINHHGPRFSDVSPPQLVLASDPSSIIEASSFAKRSTTSTRSPGPQ